MLMTCQGQRLGHRDEDDRTTERKKETQTPVIKKMGHYCKKWIKTGYTDFICCLKLI